MLVRYGQVDEGSKLLVGLQSWRPSQISWWLLGLLCQEKGSCLFLNSISLLYTPKSEAHRDATNLLLPQRCDFIKLFYVPFRLKMCFFQAQRFHRFSLMNLYSPSEIMGGTVSVKLLGLRHG